MATNKPAKGSRPKRAVPGETKRERFERLANSRTNQVLEKLVILGRLGNPDMYDYDTADVDAIFSAITEAVEETKAKFLLAGEDVPAFNLSARLQSK